jgi:hypothetical protein
MMTARWRNGEPCRAHRAHERPARPGHVHTRRAEGGAESDARAGSGRFDPPRHGRRRSDPISATALLAGVGSPGVPGASRGQHEEPVHLIDQGPDPPSSVHLVVPLRQLASFGPTGVEAPASRHRAAPGRAPRSTRRPHVDTHARENTRRGSRSDDHSPTPSVVPTDTECSHGRRIGQATPIVVTVPVATVAMIHTVTVSRR